MSNSVLARVDETRLFISGDGGATWEAWDGVVSGGSGGVQYNEGDTDALITGTAILWEDAGNTLVTASAATPLPVEVVSGGGGGAGGTEYTEGDTDASVTGTAILWEDTSDTLRPVSAAKPLPVSVITTPIAVTDNGGSLTVDGTVGISGTVTVDASGSTVPISHAALTELAAAIDTEVQVDIVGSLPAGSANIGDVDIASIAAGNNNIGDVDVATVPTDPFGANADAASTTGSISAKLRSLATNLAAVVSGSEVQADIVGALPAGTNAIGKLAANSGVDIGDVDVLSVIPGTGATNLGKAEDAAHSSGDVGVMALGVRAAAPTDRSAGPTDGDYVPLGVNEVGAQWGTLTPSANGGCSIFRSLDIDESEEDVKTSAGVVYGYYFGNVAASVRYLKFYNATAASTTVGSTTPVLTLPLPASSSGHIGFPYGIAFGTAICVAATTGVADADTGAPSANDVVINVFYK